MKIRFRTSLALLAILLSLAGAGGAAPAEAAQAPVVNGAGATFPYPLYSRWFYEYSNAHPGVKFNYQSIGSGGGIRQITAGTVDFGATDAPMTEAELKALPGPILHVPTAVGAVSIVYNLPGVPDGLRLAPDVLADIYLGKVAKWNDPRIVALNPGTRLPGDDIVVTHRSDGSGTTDIFTGYLAAVSTEWKSRVGSGKSVKWPTGLGGKGNEGVAGLVRQTPGAIGYVELAYAEQTRMTDAALRNREGAFVSPSLAATTAAAAGAAKTMPADFRVSLANAPGREAYPICGFTWLLVYRDQKDEAKGKALASFLKWALHDGQKMNAPLSYAPIPRAVVDKVDKALSSLNHGGKALYR